MGKKSMPEEKNGLKKDREEPQFFIEALEPINLKQEIESPKIQIKGIKRWIIKETGITTVWIFLILLMFIIGASIGIWFFSRLQLKKIIEFFPENMIDYQIKYPDLVDKTIALNRAFTDHFVSIFATCIGPLIPILSALIGYVWGQKSRESKEADKVDTEESESQENLE